MKQGWFSKCKVLILPLYLTVQIVIGLAIAHLRFNLVVHVPLSLASIITYFIVALKNPGYVVQEYDNKKADTEEKRTTENPDPMNIQKQEIQANIKKIEYNGLQNDLALESNIKQNDENKEDMKPMKIKVKFLEKKSRKRGDCVKEGQIGMGLVIQEPSGFVACPSALKGVERHCSECKLKQDMRVRHCLDCGKCVHTFDHHCPWLNNCIGQKNKFHFMLYLIAQQIQFFVLGTELIVVELGQFEISVLLLCVGSFLTAMVLLGITCFHFYMIGKNITTWEYLRWERIEYLKIFSRKKMDSLFNRGIGSNFSLFMWGSFCNDPIDWMRQINPIAHECVIQTKSQTERRLSSLVP